MVEREILVESGAAIVAVLAFIALLIAFGGPATNNDLSQTEAFGVVGTIVFFIVVMAIVGFWLSRKE